jgi:hypothetical protein
MRNLDVSHPVGSMLATGASVREETVGDDPLTRQPFAVRVMILEPRLGAAWGDMTGGQS